MKYRRKYKLHIVNAGVKIFGKVKNEKSKVPFRLMQDGLELIIPYMNNKRII